MQRDPKVMDNYQAFIDDHEFYDEFYFQKMFIMEQRRIKRSGKRFLLMMIDIHKIINEKGSQRIVKKLIQLLEESSRETDIKGWYKHNRTIGIIFTEVNDLIKELIVERIRNSIDESLEWEYARKIYIDCLSYPEDNRRGRKIEFKHILGLSNDLSMNCISRNVSFQLKRALDITGSILGIILFLPLFIIIAISIKLTSRGPVFFRQKRMGYGGNEFTLLKFRSMFIDNDDSVHREFTKSLIQGDNAGSSRDNRTMYKMKNDPRITRIGAFLRKTSLDELPQLFNVLSGDMSLVGPRPPIQYEVEEYEQWHKQRVLDVKPGITGVWQVQGRGRVSFNEMVRMDIQYIRQWSLLLDLMLIIKTPLALFKAEGAY